MSRRQWPAYRRKTIAGLQARPFRHIALPAQPALLDCRADGGSDDYRLTSLRYRTPDDVQLCARVVLPRQAGRVPLTVFAMPESATRRPFGPLVPDVSGEGGEVCVEVRNTGATSVGPGLLWAVRRLYPQLGQTLPERQVCDLLHAVALLRQQSYAGPITLYGEGRTAVLALYAALLGPEVAGVVLKDLPASHEDPDTPEFLGILQVADLPANLALMYPRPVTLLGKTPAAYNASRKRYEQLGKPAQFILKSE